MLIHKRSYLCTRKYTYTYKTTCMGCHKKRAIRIYYNDVVKCNELLRFSLCTFVHTHTHTHSSIHSCMNVLKHLYQGYYALLYSTNNYYLKCLFLFFPIPTDDRMYRTNVSSHVHTHVQNLLCVCLLQFILLHTHNTTNK